MCSADNTSSRGFYLSTTIGSILALIASIVILIITIAKGGSIIVPLLVLGFVVIAIVGLGVLVGRS